MAASQAVVLHHRGDHQGTNVGAGWVTPPISVICDECQ
jgi:hypothetical protein